MLNIIYAVVIIPFCLKHAFTLWIRKTAGVKKKESMAIALVSAMRTPTVHLVGLCPACVSSSLSVDIWRTKSERTSTDERNPTVKHVFVSCLEKKTQFLRRLREKGQKVGAVVTGRRPGRDIKGKRRQVSSFERAEWRRTPEPCNWQGRGSPRGVPANSRAQCEILRWGPSSLVKLNKSNK